ncbi:hypothetical protein ACFYZN_11000 [Streptomyces sp. NPDC001777]|uniref:hypothetical protein n=1 Tax=Streptomyces sp. NPDC001777 TaxID=3364608 RepID=UPI0036C3199E
MSRRDRTYENGPGREQRDGAGREQRIDLTGNGIVNHDGPENALPANREADADPTGSAEAAEAEAVEAEAAEAEAAGAEAESGGEAGDGGDGGKAGAAETVGFGSLSSLFGPDSGSGGVLNGGAPSVDGLSGDGLNGGDADLDEVALRRMMRGAVQHIEPRDGTLDRLQRAVPVRRAKRRQAVVGLAAAALLIGTAVPAFVHVANSDGSSAANPAIAGHGEQAQGGNGTETGSGHHGKDSGGDTDGRTDGDPDHPESSSSPSDSRGQDDGGNLAGGTAGPDRTEVAAMAACGPGQLGVASAETGAAGADGTVYGTFRIANVSGTECSVNNGGSVGFQTMGAADETRIMVVRHTAGDAAPGLPDPSQEQQTVLLKPSMAYEVKFAWVPKDTCPTAGGSPSPTPTEGGGAAGGATVSGGGSGEGTTDMDAQFLGEDGGIQDGSVSVMHTPEAGAPVAAATIPNACAGTIYRTGVLTPAT